MFGFFAGMVWGSCGYIAYRRGFTSMCAMFPELHDPYLHAKSYPTLTKRAGWANTVAECRKLVRETRVVACMFGVLGPLGLAIVIVENFITSTGAPYPWGDIITDWDAILASPPPFLKEQQ